MVERLLADTNILLRFLTGEPPELAQKARALVAAADTGEVELVVLPLIVAETVYTLESFYKIGASVVVPQLMAFLQSRGIRIEEEERILDALQRHREKNVHFADAYLAASAAEKEIPVVSFDRDFGQFDDICWIEPSAK